MCLIFAASFLSFYTQLGFFLKQNDIIFQCVFSLANNLMERLHFFFYFMKKISQFLRVFSVYLFQHASVCVWMCECQFEVFSYWLLIVKRSSLCARSNEVTQIWVEHILLEVKLCLTKLHKYYNEILFDYFFKIFEKFKKYWCILKVCR